MNSSLLNLLPRDMKKKKKKTKINQQNILKKQQKKNTTKKIKPMENATLIMDYYPRNG